MLCTLKEMHVAFHEKYSDDKLAFQNFAIFVPNGVSVQCVQGPFSLFLHYSPKHYFYQLVLLKLKKYAII